MALTPKQELFCIEYMKDFNGTQAAIRAGYSENTAQQISSENLSKPLVSEYLNSLINKKMDKVEIEVDDILQDIIQTRAEAASEKKHSDRLKANELLGKYKKMWTDKTELTGENGGPVKTEAVITFVNADSKPTDT